MCLRGCFRRAGWGDDANWESCKGRMRINFMKVPTLRKSSATGGPEMVETCVHAHRKPPALIRCMSRLHLPLCALCVLCLSITGMPAQFVMAQQNVPRLFPPEPEEREGNTDWFQIPLDMELQRKLNTTAQLATDGRVLEAATALQAAIEHEVDYFVMREGHRTSARGELAAWIEKLPRAVLQAYETQSGPQATFLLKTHEEEQDLEALAEASRLYLHTRSGAQAAYRLASHQLNRGRYLACLSQLERLANVTRFAENFEPALTLQRAACLIRLDRVEEARELTEGYLQRKRREKLTLGGVEYNLEELLGVLEHAEPEQLLALRGERRWPATTDWPIFRGSPQRHRLVDGFSPLPRLAWQANVREALLSERLPRKESISGLSEFLLGQLRRDQFTVMPAWNPILVGERILVSGFGTVAAFSQQDGRLLWRSSTSDDVFEYLQNDDLIERYAVYPTGEINEFHLYLMQQLVGDLAAGTLSSDGRRVFVLRGNGLVHSHFPGRGMGGMRSVTDVPLIATESNVLMGIDLETGKLLWEIGGNQGRQNEEFSRHFFLSPPLPVEHGVYALSESGQELFLSRLRPESGELLWMQPLANAEFNIMEDRPRRIRGAGLVYAEPLLIALTNSGTAIAYDPLLRELRWAFVYKEKSQAIEPPQPFRNRRNEPHTQPQDVDLLNGTQWQESIPVVHGNRVLFPPGDSQDLYCCDLTTGELKWTEPRRDGMYIEVSEIGGVMIVGKRVVRCLDMESGEERWSTPLPGGGPSGRGVMRPRTYHLATNTGGMLSLDLETGHILAETDLQDGDRRPLGNLLAAGDQLLALGQDRLVAFESLPELTAQFEAGLEETPEQGKWLLLQGQLALHLGESRRGIALLQQAYRVDPSPEIARQLTRTLLSADISEIRLSPEEALALSRMMVESEHQTDTLLRYAQALQRLERPREALDVYERVLTSDRHRSQMVAVSGERRVRADALTSGMILELLKSLPGGDRAELQTYCGQKLAELETVATLRDLLPLFSATDLEEQARLRLVQLMDESSLNPLEQEQHLRWLARAGHAKIQPEVTARLARLYLEQRRPQAARVWLARLEAEYAEENVFSDITGRAWAQQQRQAHASQQNSSMPSLSAENTQWRVTVLPDEHLSSRQEQPKPINAEHHAPLDWDGWSFELQRQEARLIARDPWNQPQWTAQLEEGFPGSGDCQLHTEGQLLLLACEGEFHVFDGFSQDTGQPRQQADTAARANTPESENQLEIRPGTAATAPLESTGEALWSMPFGQSSTPRAPGYGFVETDAVKIIGPTPLMVSWERQVGQIARLVDQRLIYREDSRILTRDARSGELLWEYETGHVEEELVWTDREHVHSLDLNKLRGQAFRLRDGHPTRRYEIPQHDRLFALTEHMAVFWRRFNPEQGQLVGFDLTAERILWQFETTGSVAFARASADRMLLADHAARKLHILNPLLDQPILTTLELPETRARRLFVVSDELNWYVHLTSKPEQQIQPLAFHSLQDVHGPVLAIDRQTLQLQWTRTLEQLRWIPRQATELPFLVYGSVVNAEKTDADGQPITKFVPRLEVLDKQTGETITTHDPALEGRLVQIRAEWQSEESSPQSARPQQPTGDDSSRDWNTFRIGFASGALLLQRESAESKSE